MLLGPVTGINTICSSLKCSHSEGSLFKFKIIKIDFVEY